MEPELNELAVAWRKFVIEVLAALRFEKFLNMLGLKMKPEYKKGNTGSG